MQYIKAPYNFVPLNKKVVSPYWAPYVSHDVPFEDGMSGSFKLVIKAESPIFIKNGMGKKEEESHYQDGKQIKPYRFSQDASGRYFIPGSSVKGMIRNVMEIMSFGYMGRNKVNDVRYSVRDFTKNNNVYDPSEMAKEVMCGWLQKDGGEYRLEQGGPIRRITHGEIERYFNLSGFSKTGKKRSAKAKHDRLPEPNPSGTFSSEKNKNGVEICRFDSDGSINGKLVVTGQPNPKKKKEFIFIESDVWEDVPSDVIKNFFFAYYDHDRTQQSEDWKFWKVRLDKGEKIPVFFRRNQRNREVLDMGLAMLYKKVYNNSVIDLIESVQGDYQNDLSEVIFGSLSVGGGALKGRVHFSHAFTDEKTKEGSEFNGVLSSPKATYYPTYIQQNGKGEYSTYHDEAQISGWKRYPVHKAGVKENQRPEKSTEKVLTRFIPLEAGASFTLTVHYHNLKKVELGALFSAITFHGNKNIHHNIGMAKPLGYGKVSLSVEGLNNLAEYLGAFESYMNAELGYDQPGWHKTDQIKELISMSMHQDNSGSAALEYMKLGRGKGQNAFVEAKKNNEFLKRYSELVSANVEVRSFASSDSIQEIKKLSAIELRKLKALRTPSEIRKENLAKAERELKEKFQERKKILLEKLRQEKERLKEKKRKELEKQKKIEKEKRDAVKQEQAKSEGLAIRIADIDYAHKNAFNALKKLVVQYCEDYYGEKEKELKKKFPGGFLPENDHAALFEAAREILEQAKPAEAKQWKKPYKKNARLKKISEWVGEEKAKSITES